MAIDTWGNLYVADLNNHTIRKITPKALAGLRLMVSAWRFSNSISSSCVKCVQKAFFFDWVSCTGFFWVGYSD